MRVVPRAGLTYTVLSLLMALGVTAIIVLTSSAHRPTVLQAAGLGFVLFSVALLVGASRLVGFSTIIVLASALIEATGDADPSWVRAILIGCGWYAAVELGWEAIERRDGSERRREVELRRVNEITTVVLGAAALGLVALAARSLAPVRTLPIQAALIIATLIAMAAVARHVRTGV